MYKRQIIHHITTHIQGQLIEQFQLLEATLRILEVLQMFRKTLLQIDVLYQIQTLHKEDLKQINLMMVHLGEVTLGEVPRNLPLDPEDHHLDLGDHHLVVVEEDK